MSRFHEPQRPDFCRLNASIDVDRRLWPQDLAQSRAHAKMLAERGIILPADRDALLEVVTDLAIYTASARPPRRTRSAS